MPMIFFISSRFYQANFEGDPCPCSLLLSVILIVYVYIYVYLYVQ